MLTFSFLNNKVKCKIFNLVFGALPFEIDKNNSLIFEVNIWAVTLL